MASYLVFLNVHPFLAETHRVNTNVLVVEGWIEQYAIRAGAEEFKIQEGDERAGNVIDAFDAQYLSLQFDEPATVEGQFVETASAVE